MGYRSVLDLEGIEPSNSIYEKEFKTILGPYGISNPVFVTLTNQNEEAMEKY